MNISTFRAMLERRGYHDFDCKEWDVMSVSEARACLDETIGEGMVHVMHVCGQGLLQADEGWNVGYEREDPYRDLAPGYYAVLVDEDAMPLAQCPGCGLPLDLARGLPRVDEPDAFIPEDDHVDEDIVPRDLEYIAGELAFHEQDFVRAETHFRTTLDLDDRNVTEACQLLGLTLVWQGRLEEAIEEFELDLEDRGVQLSGFFALWCALCQYDSAQAFVTELIHNYAQLGWVDADGKPQASGWDEEYEDEEEESSPSFPLPRDVLGLLKVNLVSDAVEDPDTPGDRSLAALVSYLRQEYHHVLALLYRSDEGAFGWARAFWLAMACLELHRETEAQTFLEQTEPGIYLPPPLLAPLRWTQSYHATFFETVGQPLLRKWESGKPFSIG